MVNVDATVQDKAIAFPTDAWLYHKARGALVRLAKQRKIDLRQSYERVSKRALMMNGRLLSMPGRCSVPDANRSDSGPTRGG